MIYKKILSVLVSLFIFVICSSSCGDIPENERLHHSWVIDENFSYEDQQMIREAIEQWVIATDGIFNPIDVSVGPVYSKQPFAVESVNINDYRVLKMEEKKRAEGYEGYCLAGLYTANDSILIVTGRYNIGTVIHEFGHFFGLDHLIGPPPDVMNSVGDKLDCISEQNIKTFCSLHNCSDHYVKSTCED